MFLSLKFAHEMRSCPAVTFHASPAVLNILCQRIAVPTKILDQKIPDSLSILQPKAETEPIRDFSCSGSKIDAVRIPFPQPYSFYPLL